jgi:hypothetical protein
VVEALGELDMSNVGLLNGALKIVVSDETTSCLLDTPPWGLSVLTPWPSMTIRGA